MNALTTLTGNLAKRFDLGSGEGLLETLKATAFKGPANDAQLTALMIVANNYGLNPWTKEIYAFPDRNNGIVPVVGVDGWSRIINENPQFDGMEFEQDAESCTCIIYRKDRKHPIRVTEYMAECKREGVGPWKSHPRRMLRHKATIQCARLAFGFVGIYEQDEAERIVEATATHLPHSNKIAAAIAKATPADSPERTEAIANFKAAAAKGTAAFYELWKATPAATRDLVRDQVATFKEICVSADAMKEDDRDPA